MSAIEILLTATFWAAVLRIATPLIFGTMGELICERAGVLNLGIEGIMSHVTIPLRSALPRGASCVWRCGDAYSRVSKGHA
jgi:hypothetical protein